MPYTHPLRRLLTIGVAAAAMILAGPAAAVGAADSGAGDRYVSNPPDDDHLVGYCDDQAQLGNNLEAQGDHDRAASVVGAANMRGCRIYTFPA
ncbi:hypothetical protein ACFWPA_01320 [Rhodococcus sp. NPDC058505]|uniref:hypothetical protein n=1 Tax=unclassified Rhodococcus (in: high G+C Gram-positive bacteria) TaxID=192944 RepID=UPI003663C0C5